MVILGVTNGGSMELKRKKIKVEDLPESKFARAVVGTFFRERRKKGFTKEGFTLQERGKNHSLAKAFYKKVNEHKLEIVLSDGVDEDKYYERLKSPDFWKEIIEFMFLYADMDILKFYSQTINGVFSFYFRHYDRLKTIVESKNLEGEERKLLADVRRWKKEDAINVFYIYITKVYRHFKTDFEGTPKGEYYVYIKYTARINHNPSIKPIVLRTSPLLRGLFLAFEPKFKEWAGLWPSMNLPALFDYEELKQLCEELGAEYANEIVIKDLDDIIGDAINKFYNA